MAGLHQDPYGVHSDSPIIACHMSAWHLFWPQISPILHFLGHRTGPLELQPAMLQNLYGSCPHLKLAAFHITQYIGDSINSRVKSSTSVTQRGPLGSLHRRICEIE